jgi:glycosyltransferase involved in cell wall biosynthesis
MKILHVIDSGGLYGAEVMLLNLVSEQVRQGIEPIIASIGDPCCGEKPLEVEARRRGLKVETFRMRPGFNIAGAFKVLRFALREGTEILHSHGYKGNILFGLMPKSLRRIPMVATLHGWTWTSGWDRMRLYEWLDRLSLRFIDAVVVVNGAMREKVRIKGLHVVNNGIPTDETHDSKTHDATDAANAIDPIIASFCSEGFTIGAIGRLSPEKGFDILLDAVKEVAETNPEVRLVIFGEGDERGALEAQIKRLGLEERVLMPGYVSSAGRFLPLFRVFVLSSLTEGLPIVILEAMRAGVPIVATRVGGVPNTLQHGRAGLLVDPSDSSDLAMGILKLVNDLPLRALLLEQGKILVRDEFSSNKMAEEYRKLYCDLVDANPANNIYEQTSRT